MAWQAALGRMVLFGGENVPASTYVHLTDTWELTGTSWLQTTGSTRPGAPGTSVVITTSAYAMAYDVPRQRMVLIDYAGATWEYNNSTWSRVFPTNPGPVTFGRGLAFDPVSARVLGVVKLNGVLETWSFSGTDWTRLSTTGPTVSGFALATDTIRNKVMLFGGATANTFASQTNTLWEWSGSGWAQVTVAGTLPPPQIEAVMTYDRSRRKLVVQGGRSSASTVTNTWEFNGTAWSFLPSPQNFGDKPAMAYDEARQATVLFGGSSSPTNNQVWELKR
jgi:hypothetical protein